MLKDTILSVGAAFLLTVIIMPFLIPFLHKLKFGQQERELGPEAHKKKAGTPTMGGIGFILGAVVPLFVLSGRYPLVLPVVLLVLGFGLIGFLDDYLKVVRKNTDGLSPLLKMAGQFGVATVFLVFLMHQGAVELSIRLPFTSKLWDMKWLYIPFFYLVVLGTDNAVNLTDGVDGLCTQVTMVVCAFFGACAMALQSSCAPAAGAMLGALAGFLAFNLHPAKVFMGDTGSLALGAFVAGMSFLMGMPLFILLFGLVYLMEILSVMIQVSYFKLTKGKRVFKMTPIHHHFELSGWSETQVVGRATILTMLCCLLAYLALVL